jgi:hypothetical protein
MKPPASFSTLGSEFDAFLYAAIGEDRNGMPLSVVSALARMDLDPWHEAAGLAAVSVETATGKLTSLLAALSDPILTGPSPGITAARLIALLPRRLDTNSRSPATKGGITAAIHPPPRMNVILLAIYIILMLGTQFALLRRPPPAHDTAHALAPPAAASHAPLIAPEKRAGSAAAGRGEL